MSSTRRNFLKALGSAAALGLVGGAGDSQASIPIFNKRYNVLEIFLRGGLSHRDTLWTFADVNAPACAIPNNSWVSEPCRWASSGKDAWKEVDWANDPMGPVAHDVPSDRVPSGGTGHFFPGVGGAPGAPCSAALNALVKGGSLDNPSLLNRTRVLALRHAEPALFPHEAAAPYVLTGSRLGRGNMAGMAAAVAAATANSAQSPTAPVGTSLVFYGPVSFDHVEWACSTGNFGGAFQPPAIQFPDSQFTARLQASIGRNAERSGLDRYYQNRVEAQLAGTRSGAFSAFRSASSQIARAQELSNVLAPVSNDLSPGNTDDRITRMIRAAATLLKGPTTRYVGILDPGLYVTYDTHATGGTDPFLTHASMHNFNLWWVLAQIQANFTPADLLNTLIVVHSEFGRRVTNEIADHNPRGYAALAIGGPITSAAASGYISNQNKAYNAITPTDLRTAMYLAAQIEPYQPLTSLPQPIAAPFSPFDNLAINLPYETARDPVIFNPLNLNAAQRAGNETAANLETILRPALAAAVFGA